MSQMRPKNISGKITTISSRKSAANARHHRLMVEPAKAAAESRAKRPKKVLDRMKVIAQRI